MPTKPAVKVEVKEPKQVIRPKYVFKQYNSMYRAVVRIDGEVNRLGVFKTMAYAVQAQKDYCIERGTTYEAVFGGLGVLLAVVGGLGSLRRNTPLFVLTVPYIVASTCFFSLWTRTLCFADRIGSMTVFNAMDIHPGNTDFCQ